MATIYESKTTEIKPFTYRTLLITPDENSEFSIKHSRQQPKHTKKVVLLNLVGRTSTDDIDSYESLEQANLFPLAHHIDNDKQEYEQYSKGLVQHFLFLIELQRLWKSEYDELIDLPRSSRGKFSFRKSDKDTHQYREAQIKALLEPIDPSQAIARTTATEYIGVVVKFYSFQIRNGYKFNKTPFEYEVVSIQYQGDSTSIGAYLGKDVHIKDLRLNLGKSRGNEGGALSSSHKNLNPITNREWQAVRNIPTNTSQVIKNVAG
ncbi:hypothetical protein QL989_03635 [Pseudoalteromonas sp. APC 3224]|uniref:hypothetical protein n=1 Tax=Pseudoalteromonas sp. APC 3224 TaxID=3035203 RepID=UPI0025B4C8A6|nr:hypothetical protein [Pseudoalteromonas sp. APC 3224]MDN3484433.1 hypothetical protein [Pseudoalteromonas sp. APC 3224]